MNDNYPFYLSKFAIFLHSKKKGGEIHEGGSLDPIKG